MVVLVAPDPNSENPPSVLDLENNQLKPAGRLNETLSADVHPFNVVQVDDALPLPTMKNDPILFKNQLPVA